MLVPVLESYYGEKAPEVKADPGYQYMEKYLPARFEFIGKSFP